MAFLVALHFWRVRKDGGLSAPPDRLRRRVHSWPHLVFRELLVLVLVLVVVHAAALLFDAPLEEIADATRTPNPAKAPWYFLGLQELVHYGAIFGGVVVPTAARPGAPRAPVPRHAPARRRGVVRARAARRERRLRGDRPRPGGGDDRRDLLPRPELGLGLAVVKPQGLGRRVSPGLLLSFGLLSLALVGTVVWAVWKEARAEWRCPPGALRGARGGGAGGRRRGRDSRRAADLASRPRPRGPLHLLPPGDRRARAEGRAAALPRAPGALARDPPARPLRLHVVPRRAGRGHEPPGRRPPAHPALAGADGLARAHGGPLRDVPPGAAAAGHGLARPGPGADGRPQLRRLPRGPRARRGRGALAAPRRPPAQGLARRGCGAGSRSRRATCRSRGWGTSASRRRTSRRSPRSCCSRARRRPSTRSTGRRPTPRGAGTSSAARAASPATR